MRNWLLTLAIAVAACAASFGAFYAMNREPRAIREATERGDAMEWLRTEFKLTDTQYAAIKQLHDRYGTVCARHCSAIMAAEHRGAPRAEVAALESECVRSMTDHFHQVAALMAPEQGQRYLSIVMPRVLDYDHRGTPNLAARP